MPNQHCFTPLQLCAVRIAKLESTGHPDNGATNGYVANAVISLAATPENVEGDDFEQKDGCGNICASYKGDDRLKRENLTLQICHNDPAIIELMTGASTILSGENIIGFQMPSVDSTGTRYVSLEAWSKAWDGSQQAVPTFTSTDAAWFHYVYPKTRWVLGDYTIENNFMITTLTGVAEENDYITANGPFDDWPAAVAAIGGITRTHGWFYDPDLPTGDCDYIPVTSAAS